MRHAVVGEAAHKVGLHDAKLDSEVCLVDAERQGGGCGQTVAHHQHGQGHRVVREVCGVVPAQMRECDGLEEHDVALEDAEVDASAVVVRGDVHAVVREAGRRHEEARVDVCAEKVVSRGKHHVVEAGVQLELAHALGPEDDVPRHELPEHAGGADGVQEQVAGRGVVPRGQGALDAAQRAKALGVHHVVQLEGDAAVHVLGGQVGDDVDLTVVVEAGGVAVRQAAAAALHGEQRLHLRVLVHGQHHAVHVAERVHGIRAVTVLGVEHGVGVVGVGCGGDIDLVHGGNRVDRIRQPEALLEHPEHGWALHDVRERRTHLAVQELVPPVRGVVAPGVRRGDEVIHILERRAVLGAGQLATHNVVVRHHPAGEGLLHVHQRIQAQGQEVVRVLQQQPRHGRALVHVRALERALFCDEVREFLARVR
mmetsp:Transcript_35294/g.88265  ORF Transcript_35294/g.88265 Transcript_35294/m.88265 type:complete len:424 (+) Transcript_35294:563-1834(+)